MNKLSLTPLVMPLAMIRRTIVSVAALASLLGCNNSAITSPTSRADANSEWRPIWGSAESSKLRPGSLIATVSTNCTAGFLFVDPVAEVYYMSTAAHCADSADGTTYDGTGTEVTIEGIGVIGTVVYDSDGPVPISTTGNDPLSRLDFALVQLAPDVNLEANPQMFLQDGPTGFIGCSDMSPQDSIAIYGHGQIFEPAEIYSRDGPLYQCTNSPGYEEFVALVPTFFGDSGGPVLHVPSGRALALVTSFGVRAVTATAGLYGPTLDHAFEELAKAGFGSVALATVDGGYAVP